MKRYALLGEKLGHSLSVPIHQAIFRILGINADYRLMELPRGTLEQRFPALREELAGMNVTIPYKQEILPLLTSLHPFAARVGAVNTVDVRGENTVGYNTDVAGLMAMLRHHGISPQGQEAFILGTGGASKAAVVALEELGAARITLVSRHPQGEEISYEALTERFSGVLVNCTPVGMYPHGEGCPLSDTQLKSMLPRATGVADLIYNPPQTRLTQAATAAGVPACTGLYMLVHQAVEAEKIWQGLPLDEDLTQQVIKELKLP